MILRVLSMGLVNLYYLSSSILNLNLSSPLEVTEEQDSRYLSSNIYK